jgi:hypothetical protein
VLKNAKSKVSLRSRTTFCLTIALITGSILGAGLVESAPSIAGKGKCSQTKMTWDKATGQSRYVCTQYEVAPVGGPAAGAGTSCDLAGLATFCMGIRPCFYDAWHPPYLVPPGKPAGKPQLKLRMCLVTGPAGPSAQMRFGSWEGTPVWVRPGDVGTEPSLVVQARQAVGALRLPRGDLRFSPKGRSFVGLDTWWWMEGLPAGRVKGSSAFGLLAVATPVGLRVDPGDGSEVLECPFVRTVVVAERDCASAYARSSASGTARVGGQPAFVATATPTWRVAFVGSGTPVTIDGFDPVVEGPTVQVPVPVAEIQTIVEGTG